MQMKVAVFVVAAAGLFVAGAAAVQAAPFEHDAATLEISSQATTMRTRQRIRVYPRYPRRNFHTVYPLPYAVEYPGPRAVRHCVSRLVPEYRPSGPVIVPRMRCWWG